ncbi:MAG: bifunctional methylenetetrahydrofolate dehydrogenase/methenyltetrahydrofolate cyclohydrolase FolD [Pseudomonadota bacterium]|nr:bifunctional methylenetetrahydrofolate dehydrogenase/methenyltetrahydrofolate cyclohydrolase FolD [Pseudomonadota bacterium]
MTATIISGAALAASVRAELAARVETLGYKPGLAVVLVGDDPASAVYVRNKDRAAHAAGLRATTRRLPAETTQAELLEVVDALNRDPDVDGILVQFPLPTHIAAEAVIEAIDPAKDVDGFHPFNVGRLQQGAATLAPCTPRGVIKLLRNSQATLRGARALVLGRSSIVGRPVATMLLNEDATVTIAHSRTVDLPDRCREADILIAAVGRPEMVRGEWIKPGAVVIDVGINRLDDGRLVGDVAFAEAVEVASAITPVPGGVGPMTIACLLENTVAAAIARRT